MVSRSTPLRFQGSRNISVHVERLNRNRFSIALFLLGAQVDPKHILQPHFPAVFDPGKGICIQDYLVDAGDQLRPPVLQLLIAVTDRVLPGPSVDEMEKYKKLKQLSRVDVPFGICVATSNDDIRSMI